MISFPSSDDSGPTVTTFVTRHMGWIGMALAFAMCWVQTLPYIGTVSTCENADSGTSRGDLCDLMSPWGHGWLFVVPPILILMGGVWGQRAGRLSILSAFTLGAIVAGIALPLVAFEATSPR